MNGLCPQCKTAPVIKTGRFGAMPKCQSCRNITKLGIQERTKKNRQLRLWKGHYDSDGNRYPNNATIPRTADPSAIERRRVANIQRVKKRYYKNPEVVKRRRLSTFLTKAGLSIEWYDQEVAKGCGICETHDPGIGWCIDHDHSCHPYGNRQGCKKCIRGILCNPCNLALGMMRDNPARLRKAACWVEKPISTGEDKPTSKSSPSVDCPLP